MKIFQFFSSLAEMRVTLCFFCALAFAFGAPRSRNNLPQTVYDQKQTGDYNIQLHLKDFQIIALLGDESLDGFGDYDYSYDYSDFTVKPSNHSTTAKPEASTLKVENVTTSTEKNEIVTSVQNNLNISQVEITTTQNTNSPDKIKVQILTGSESPNRLIVPNDETGGSSESPQLALGEILHYRRCAVGYARDKRGRCRRLRRPSGQTHQFNIGRLANNLASKFGKSEESESNSESASVSVEI